MTKNPQQELIWQGRLHLGDEPGIFGDAAYAGLGAELPLTIFSVDPKKPPANPATLIVDTTDVQTYPGYPGHEIVVSAFEEIQGGQSQWMERQIGSARMVTADNNQKRLSVSPGSGGGPFFLSVRMRVDTRVAAGLYDDFHWIRLSLMTGEGYYASFGFISQ